MSRRGSGEGSIYSRKDGRWAASVTTPDGRRRTVYGKTRQEAAQKLLKAQRTIAEGLPLAGERRAAAQFLETWLSDSAARKVRPKTFRRYQEIVRLHIVPSVGRIALSRLTPQDVERMMAEQIGSGSSPRSAAHSRAVLRTALNAAMRYGYVGRNVASLAEPPHIQEREAHALTPAAARALLDAVRGDRLEALFGVALALGLRQSEALGLRWSDVDLDVGAISIQRTIQRVNGEYQFFEPKTPRSRRTVALPRPLIAALRAHHGRQFEDRLLVGPAWQGDAWGDLVFTDEIGRPLSGSYVTRRFQRLVRLAGLPSMRYHDLRHGAASLMAAQGVPARVAMEILGHAQISTTMNIYAHIAPEFQREAMDKVSASLWSTV